jgi:hypothetical protein
MVRLAMVANDSSITLPGDGQRSVRQSGQRFR